VDRPTWADRSSIETRLRKLHWHIHLRQMEKSAVAEHNFNSEDTKILSTKSRYMNRNIKEVMNTELHPNNVCSAGHGNLSVTL
jgi:reverse gyrase